MLKAYTSPGVLQKPAGKKKSAQKPENGLTPGVFVLY